MARTVIYTVGTEGDEREITVQIHDGDVDPWGLDETFRHVETDVPRLDALAKASGTAVYTMDVHRPRMAWAGFVFSPHARAKVLRVDATEAEVLPGVLSIKTFEGREVTYAGQVVAAVCAETPAALDDALAALQVSYQPLPHAVTTEAAARGDVPKPGGGRGEIEWNSRMSRKPEAAREAVRSGVVVKGTWRTQVQTHSALEPHGTVCEIDGDGATVWASTQGTGTFRGLAGPLGVGPRLRVITEHMGGGFGAKFGPLPTDLIGAQFAKETGRPVHTMLSRRHEHLLGGNRPDSIHELELAGTQDGMIRALVGRVMGTAGNGPRGAGTACTAVYRIPAIAMEQATVPTYTQRGAAFRAPGHPQGLFALEGAIEAYAAEIGMDPLEVRRKNDPHPLRQIQWGVGAERIGWSENRRKTSGSDEGPLKRGVGCAAARWASKGRGEWVVDLRVQPDGRVVVMSAVQDIGTGTRTLLAILVAEEMGLDPDQIDVRIGDTSYPAAPGSGGSTTAPSMGPPCREAGRNAREALRGLVAGAWGVEPSAVKDDVSAFTGPGGKRSSFAQACALIGDEGLLARGQRRRNFDGYENETAGCQFAQVAVDTDTGVITVEKIVAVHDCGRVVNTLATRSQVNGGVIQGVSYALFENKQLDIAQGDMVNPTLDTYRILGMQDCPEIDVVLTEMSSGFNNVGMMGIGEPATVPTAAAVANAVYNAIGVQPRELPMTPARILALLGKV